jgi:lipopolysaccharide biosynthesis glycosyltransferase
VKANASEVLVTLSDNNYVDQAKQLFVSARRDAGWEGDLLLVAQGVADDDRRWFEDRGIIFYEARPLADRLESWFPTTILSKLYLFTPEFKAWDQVVYLDGDIILEGSLDPLVGRQGFCAVADVGRRTLEGQLHSRGYLKRNASELIPSRESLLQKYDGGAVAFNVGMMSFTTDAIDEEFFDELLDLFRRYGGVSPFVEQLILNLAFYEKWNELPVVFNNFHCFQFPLFRFRPRPAPGLVNHFIFGKPWAAKLPYWSERWRENLAAADTAFDEPPPAPRSRWTEEEIERRSREIIAVRESFVRDSWARIAGFPARMAKYFAK